MPVAPPTEQRAYRALAWLLSPPAHAKPAQASAFAGCDSKVSEQVWELYGNAYRGSWLIICPARRPGELFGGSGELGEAVPDH